MKITPGGSLERSETHIQLAPDAPQLTYSWLQMHGRGKATQDHVQNMKSGAETRPGHEKVTQNHVQDMKN